MHPPRCLPNTLDPNKEDQSIPWWGGTHKHPNWQGDYMCIPMTGILVILNQNYFNSMISNSNTTKFYPFLKWSSNHAAEHNSWGNNLSNHKKCSRSSKMTRSTLSKKPPQKKEMKKIMIITNNCFAIGEITILPLYPLQHFSWGKRKPLLGLGKKGWQWQNHY